MCSPVSNIFIYMHTHTYRYITYITSCCVCVLWAPELPSSAGKTLYMRLIYASPALHISYICVWYWYMCS